MNTTASSIRLLIASDEPRYLRILDQARKECRELSSSFRDHPEWVSGWGHQFACPECAAHLTFDFSMNFNPPNTFICPNCGKAASGQAFDEAWVY